jgi:hypothetical protein
MEPTDIWLMPVYIFRGLSSLNTHFHLVTINCFLAVPEKAECKEISSDIAHITNGNPDLKKK